MTTYAHPFNLCICARCGPPWRNDRPRPTREDDFAGWLTWNSYMALCPTCGDKRCPGAIDHHAHPAPDGDNR